MDLKLAPCALPVAYFVYQKQKEKKDKRRVEALVSGTDTSVDPPQYHTKHYREESKKRTEILCVILLKDEICNLSNKKVMASKGIFCVVPYLTLTII